MNQSQLPRILLCDDEPNLRKVLGALLQQQGYEVHAEADGAAALERICSSPSQTFDVVITDLRMPNLDGMGLLKQLSQREPNLPVIVLTAHGSVDSAVEAVKMGAFDYLEKPFEREQIHQVIQKAVATHWRSGPSLGSVPSETLPTEDDFKPQAVLLGPSPAITKVRAMIKTAAASPSAVLITGEIGSGKELIAHSLHHYSPRQAQPFMRINCAAVPKEWIESELFGHEAGILANTPARPGRFELADGGTLFLDEVSAVPKDLQVKLLRALQEGKFERVGGIESLHVNVRIIAATHVDLNHLISQGQFRDDLYYRLSVVPIHLPPLRKRLDDLPKLVEYFISSCNQRLGKSVQGMTEQALQALCEYPWPGNLRELENLIERMVLFASTSQIELGDLPESILSSSINSTQNSERENSTMAITALNLDESEQDSRMRYIRLPISSFGKDLKEAVRTGSRVVEETLIREALETTNNNVTRSARLLGISRRSLQSKMKELGLREFPNDNYNSHKNKPDGE